VELLEQYYFNILSWRTASQKNKLIHKFSLLFDITCTPRILLDCILFKVVSSVDPGVVVTLNIDHDDTCEVCTSAERIEPTELEKLHNQGTRITVSKVVES